MAHDEQLAWEERAGKPAAVASFAAAFMAIAAGIYLPVALSSDESGADGLLESADREAGDFIVAGALQALGLLLLIPALLYLYRATRYREPRMMPAAAVLVVLGGLTLAVVTVLRQLELLDIADSFFPDVARGQRDLEQAAEDYIEDELSPALQGISLGGSIALAFAVVMISLNAMRAGLLSRFMGILGIFVGIVLVIPLGVQILQLFWFAALGLLFLEPLAGGARTGVGDGGGDRMAGRRSAARGDGAPARRGGGRARTAGRCRRRGRRAGDAAARLAQAAQEAPLRRQAPTSSSAGTGRPR